MTQRDNPEIKKRYNSKRWQKLRKIKILNDPFCERCLAKGIYTPAFIIHHKEYINENNYYDDNIFYNIDNLESLCLECHNIEHFSTDDEYYFDSDGNVLKK